MKCLKCFILAHKQHGVLCICFKFQISFGRLYPSLNCSFSVLLHACATLLLHLQDNCEAVVRDVYASVNNKPVLFFVLKIPS